MNQTLDLGTLDVSQYRKITALRRGDTSVGMTGLDQRSGLRFSGGVAVTNDPDKVAYANSMAWRVEQATAEDVQAALSQADQAPGTQQPRRQRGVLGVAVDDTTPVARLRQLCSQFGLSDGGTRQQILARLLGAGRITLAQPAPAAVVAAPEDEKGGQGEGGDARTLPSATKPEPHKGSDSGKPPKGASRG